MDGLSKGTGIFVLVGQTVAVETTGVAHVSPPIAAGNDDGGLRLREDKVTEPNRRDDYQKPSPATQDGMYLVPKVID